MDETLKYVYQIYSLTTLSIRLWQQEKPKMYNIYSAELKEPGCYQNLIQLTYS